MAEKSKKPIVRTKVATEKKTTANTKTIAKKTVDKPKNVDIVEEAKKELKKMEAEQAADKKAKKADSNNSFAWGTFIGAVLLTSAAFVLGFFIKDQMQKSKINKFLPELIAGLGGGMAVEKIGNLTDESGIYKFSIKFADVEDEFTSAITKDGRYFFVDMSYEVPKLLEEIKGGDATANADTTTTTCENITKTDAPLLEVYVSSDCSHCHDLEGQIASAVSQVPALANSIKLHYVGGVNENNEPLSLFGDTAAGQENLRQVCIQAKDAGAFWPYVGCMSASGDTESCQKTARVATNIVNQCMTDGSGLELIVADNEAATAHNVSGTPTLYINDTQHVSDIDFGGRVPDSIKQIVCCGSATQPDFCSQTLTATETAE